jgi:hypothetical protein
MLESIPSALGMYLPVLLILILGSIGVGISAECFNAVAMIVVTLVGYVNLVSLCIPFTRWRASVCIGIGLALAAAAPLSVFAADLLALIPGDILSLPRDILGFLPAFENVGFLIGMVGVGLSLGILIQVFKKDLKRIVFNITDKIKGDKT